MLRSGTQIRLTRAEAERFTLYTGFEPVGVKTLKDLDAYVARCKAYYWGVSRHTRALHILIDEQRSRCLASEVA